MPVVINVHQKASLQNAEVLYGMSICLQKPYISIWCYNLDEIFVDSVHPWEYCQAWVCASMEMQIPERHRQGRDPGQMSLGTDNMKNKHETLKGEEKGKTRSH